MTIFWIRNRNDFADFTEHMDSAWSSGLIMAEKATTFGAAEACVPNEVEKPTTFGAAKACGSDMVEKPTTMAMPQAFCSF